MIEKITIRIFKYETEKESAIKEILSFFGEKYKEDVVEGFFKDKIKIYTIESKNKELLKKIFDNMEEKNFIKDNILEFIDDSLRLHLKFDKQYFYEHKKFRLGEGDVIKIVVHFKKSKDLNKDIKNILEFIKRL